MRWLGRLYELFWRLAPGRPWTYEIRDWSDRHPGWAVAIALPVSAGVVAGQVAAVIAFGWWAVPVVLVGDGLAVLPGHLYWDTAGKYVRPTDDFRRPS